MELHTFSIGPHDLDYETLYCVHCGQYLGWIEQHNRRYYCNDQVVAISHIVRRRKTQ